MSRTRVRSLPTPIDYFSRREICKGWLSYFDGVLVLSKDSPQVILYRSLDLETVLTPTLPQERLGTVANVVFPNAIDRSDDFGPPNRFDVYYGMDAVGRARLRGRRRSGMIVAVTILVIEF